ncbi:MAG: aldo/keto reductase [Hyphomicrobiales bacterium]|nr:aldo/keto reductase [Hyphomicrobiales bacterium]
MGEDRGRRREEIAALREGIALGMTLIDTAEMYGEGRTEELVGEAVAGLRDKVFIVSKAYPQNASSERLPIACERSLRRLGTDHLDLYLLHWRGSVPLAETVEAFEELRKAGKIRRWGVSNFDTDDMNELFAAGGKSCATNQILYNFARRGAEFDLLPLLTKHQIPAMAYSPIQQGQVPESGVLAKIAGAHDATPTQIALAFLLRRKDLIIIPKAGSVSHVRENHEALAITFSPEDLTAIDRAYPPPRRKTPLGML